MITRVSVILCVFLFVTACEEGEILPGVSVPEETDSDVRLTRSVPATLYIGVAHQLTLEVDGGNAGDFKVSVGGSSTANAQLDRTSASIVEVVPTTPGELSLEVEDGNGDELDPFIFRVKRIPDPVARLGNQSGGRISSGEFRAQGGVGAFLDDFDFDAKCDIVGFELVYLARRQDPIPSSNAGARYNSNSQNLVSRAVPGDIYLYDNVRARCPGDQASRSVNSMVFFIR